MKQHVIGAEITMGEASGPKASGDPVIDPAQIGLTRRADLVIELVGIARTKGGPQHFKQAVDIHARCCLRAVEPSMGVEAFVAPPGRMDAGCGAHRKLGFFQSCGRELIAWAVAWKIVHQQGKVVGRLVHHRISSCWDRQWLGVAIILVEFHFSHIA